MNSRFLFLSLMLCSIIFAGCGQLMPGEKTGESGPNACTQEAMLCPDGSTVGRVGPNCEFAECPKTSVNNKQAPVACGMIDGQKVDCAEGQICASFAGFSSLPQTRCLEANFCEKYTPCAMNEACVLQESWPVQIRCVPKNGSDAAEQISADVPKDAMVEDGMTVCAQDMKTCPDGSMVSRSGPNCEFVPCA